MKLAKSEKLLACNHCQQVIYHISSTKKVRGICQKCGRKIISFKGDLYWQLESPGKVTFEEIKIMKEGGD